MRTRTILYLFVCSFILSCTKEVEINIPPSKPKLIVYSTFVPFTIPYPKNFEVRVYSSAHIFDTVKYPITDAIARFFKDDELYDTLKYSSDCDCYSLTGMFFPEPQEEYKIIVEKDGFESVTSNTSIPSKVFIRDTVINPVSYINEFGSAVGEIQFSFTDPINEKNYYEIALSSHSVNYDDYASYFEIFTNATLITSQSYYPDLIRFDVPYPKFLLFRDDNINGQSVTLTIYYNPPQWFGEINYISTHYRTLHLRNVTKEYFDFKTTSIQQDYAKREDFLYGMGEPINVISNIENGFGVFAGFNNDYITFKIDSVVVNK